MLQLNDCLCVLCVRASKGEVVVVLDSTPEWRRDEYYSISSHKQHRNTPLGCLSEKIGLFRGESTVILQYWTTYHVHVYMYVQNRCFSENALCKFLQRSPRPVPWW